MSKNVYIVGIKGLPANYGGFETMVEYLVEARTGSDISYTVFCEKGETEGVAEYKGARLVYLPFKANGFQSVLFDFTAILYSVFRSGTILILGTSGTVAVPLVKFFGRRKRIITNMGGLEWQRSKWGAFAKWFLKLSESMAARFSDVLVADNQKLVDYVADEYGVTATYIPYGGDHCPEPGVPAGDAPDYLRFSSYFIAIARCQPDNNIEMIMDAFVGSDENLLFISNWDSSPYGEFIKNKYGDNPNIQIAGPIYDVNELSWLRGSALGYIHGHSAGGTNPALVEAMWQGLHIFAFSNGFNQCTAGSTAAYFESAQELSRLLAERQPTQDPNWPAHQSAQEKYTWQAVAESYTRIL